MVASVTRVLHSGSAAAMPSDDRERQQLALEQPGSSKATMNVSR